MKLIKHIFCLMALALSAAAGAQTNRLVIPDIEAASGKTVQIPVNLENMSDVIALQFDLTLPDGITAGQDDVSLTARSANHTVTARNMGGKLRVLVFSPDNTPIRGNAGTLIYINAAIPGELQQGTVHQLVITDPMLSDTNIDDVLTGYEAGAIIITPSADLTPTNIRVSPSQAGPGDQVAVSWTVENIGALPTNGGWREQVYVQRGDDQCLLATVHNTDALVAGGIMSRSVTSTLPQEIGVDGAADIRVKITPNSDCGEPVSAQGNNSVSATGAITLAKRLTMTVPPSHAENGSRTVRCTLTRSGSKRQQQTFALAVTGTGDAGRITVPATVTIEYGNASAYFDIAVTNDKVVNTGGDYTITATGSGYDAVSADITIVDDEKPQLSLTLPTDDITEGDTFTAVVTSDYAPAADLAVKVFCDKPERFTYPSNLILPAGETAVTFQITARQNDVIQGTITPAFAVSAEGYLTGDDVITLVDDDIPVIELSVTPTTVSENAGYYAIEATLRRTSNINTVANIRLNDNSHGVLQYDRQITLQKGTETATFNIGIVDDANVNGERTYRLTAAVYLTACSCTAQEESGGAVEVEITVLDNDGPALAVTTDRSTWPEGGTGSFTISHNTVGGLPTALTVALTTDLDDMLVYDHNPVIPAGQTSVTVPVTIKRNDVSGDNANVTVTVDAPGFTKGITWVQVSDQTIPDAFVKSVSLPSETIYAGGKYTFTAVIGNKGFAAIPDGMKVTLINGSTEIASAYVAAPIAPDSEGTVTFSDVVFSDKVGNMNVHFSINPTRKVAELLFTNNQSERMSVEVISPLVLEVDPLPPIAENGEVIHITGRASSHIPNTPLEGIDVEAYIINNGHRAVAPGTTDAAGNFAIDYLPVAGQVGHFDVGACYPGEKVNTPMAGFEIYGLNLLADDYIKAEMVVGYDFELKIPINNPSSLPIHNLRLEPTKLPEGLQYTFETVPAINPGEDMELTIILHNDVPSPVLKWYLANFLVISDEGVPLPFTVYTYSREREPKLVSELVSLKTTTNIHASRTYPFTVTNKGNGDTGRISLVLPDWMKAETPLTMPSLAMGESADVVLRFDPTPQMSANLPVTGYFSLNCENGGGLTIPYSVTPVSDLTGTLVVKVCDEYTYYSAEQPMVKNANVQLRDCYTNTIVAELNSGEEGFVEFADIPEGYYKIRINADKHDSYESSVIVDPGTTTVKEAFLSYQAISITWNVEETEVEDVYDIVTTVRFETHVPKPVVIISCPKKFDLEDYLDNSRNLFYVTVTNKGLITAKNTRVTIPTATFSQRSKETGEWMHAHFEWSGAAPEPFDLAPQQTVAFPCFFVKGEYREPSKIARRRIITTDDGRVCTGPMDVNAEYDCGDGSEKKLVESFNVQVGMCDGGSGGDIGGGGGGGGGGGAGSPGGGKGNGGGGGSGQKNYAAGDNPDDCDGCTAKIMHEVWDCMWSFLPGGKVKDAYDGYKEIKKNGVAGAVSVAGSAAQGKAVDKIAEKVPGFDKLVAVWTCRKTTTEECVNAAHGNSKAPSNDPRRAKAADNILDVTHQKGQYSANSLENNLSYYKEFIGTFEGGWADASVETLYDVCLAMMKSDNVAYDTPEKYASLKPEELSTEEFNTFVQRIINTYRWEQGLSYDADNVIDLDRLIEIGERQETLYNELHEMGYSDIDELNDELRDLFTLLLNKESNSVCASVVLQFEQRLVMTRQAFRGTLKVTNGHPTGAMEDVRLLLKLTSTSGQLATSHEFQINLEDLKGFEGTKQLGEGWTLAPNSDGTATILFIPTRYAAPDKDEQYYFGGTLSYFDPYTGVTITRDLQPVTMTVRPSPVLCLDYFMQRDLYGDDPLTEDVIEPIVPGEFSLLIRNTGYGDATKVNMTTQQPKIVENEKGLYIDFQIIGSTLNGRETSMGIGEKIINNFGTIPAGSTAYAQWWLTSTLLGHFTEYDVSVTHVTSYDNPDLSLLDEVNIHPLIRSIMIDDTPEVPLMGFLADDHFDYFATPDHLYLTDGSVFEVCKAESASIENIGPSQYRLTVKPDFTGWNYGKVTDPTGGRSEIESVVRVSDSKQMPVRNFWLTDRTLLDHYDPIMENLLHFADLFPTAASEQYIITFKPCPDVELDVEISGVPDTDHEYLEEQIDHIDLRFNKPIDPATFTVADVQVCLQGEILGDDYYSIAAVDGSNTDFRIDFPAKFVDMQGGFFVVTVQCKEITDYEGFTGSAGRRCSWIFYRNPYFTMTTSWEPAELGTLKFVRGSYDDAFDEMAPGYKELDINPEGYHMFEAMPGHYIYADVPEGWTARWTITNTDKQGNATVTELENPAIAYPVDVLMSNTEYHAAFERQLRNIRIDEDFEGTINGRQYVDGGNVTGAHTGAYRYGDVLTITAETEYGYTFEGWYLVTFPQPGVRDVMLISTNPQLTYTVDRKSATEAFHILDGEGRKTTSFVDESALQFDSPDFNWLIPLWTDRHDRFYYTFREGWNWVSFNDETYSFSRFMTASRGNFDVIEDGDRSYRFSLDEGWVGSIPAIVPHRSYRVHCTSSFDLLVNAVTPVIDETPITVSEGWNWIGYTPRRDMTIDEALSTYSPAQDDVIKDYDGFAVYDNGEWKGTLTGMSPGVGYQYYTTTPDSFTYNSAEASQQPAPRRAPAFDYSDPQPMRGAYPDNMTVLAEVHTFADELVAESAGCRVLAFVGNECRGVGEYVDNSHVFLTIYGTEATQAALEAPRRAPVQPETVRYEVVTPSLDRYRVTSENAFDLTPQGTFAAPVILKMDEHETTGVGNITDGVKLFSARPNPVHDTLRLVGLTDLIRSWHLFSVNGVLAASGTAYDNARGIDMSRLPAGNYVLAIDSDLSPQTLTIIKH